ncbi:MAG TPA: hypothetical protein VER76_12780, partial [Pyrinomonadaceae bacterium]|nr:hypothetical protein [Pyrinomonadaceae bacterium]
RKMKENDLIKIPHVHGDFIGMDYDTGKEISRFNELGWMEFRYPPIPPNSGFNIFGSFRSLVFNQVQGHLVMGSRTLDINVPSDLELQDINSLHVDGGVIQVPIRWDAKENVANIHLQATARTTLNGEPLGRGFDMYRQQVEYVLLFSSILSAIGAVIQIVYARRSLKQRG